MVSLRWFTSKFKHFTASTLGDDFWRLLDHPSPDFGSYPFVDNTKGTHFVHNTRLIGRSRLVFLRGFLSASKVPILPPRHEPHEATKQSQQADEHTSPEVNTLRGNADVKHWLLFLVMAWPISPPTACHRCRIQRSRVPLKAEEVLAFGLLGLVLTPAPVRSSVASISVLLATCSHAFGTPKSGTSR